MQDAHLEGSGVSCTAI